MTKIPVLLLVSHHHQTKSLGYYDDWLDAFRAFGGFEIEAINIAEFSRLKRDDRNNILRKIETAPFIVALHSTNGDGVAPLAGLLPALQNRRGLFASFIGNEVNLPLAPIKEKIEFLQASAVDVIATQLLTEAGEWLYAPVKSAKAIISIPHALNPATFQPGRALRARPVDIGARSHRYTVHIGDEERVALHRYFENYGADRHGLVCDIQLGGGRFDRAGWSRFLSGCKATISTEAGSAYLSRDDAVIHEVQALLEQQVKGRVVLEQDGRLRSLLRTVLPPSVRALIRKIISGYTVEDYDLDSVLNDEQRRQLQEVVFTEDKRAPKHSKAISSRHFEAVGCKTVQIMTPGRYNDILEAGKHYIEIKPDFSNIDDVMRQFQDLQACQTMVDKTYDYMLAHHSYQHRMADLHQTLLTHS